jgi:branched-chain amino acid transport system permease protein
MTMPSKQEKEQPQRAQLYLVTAFASIFLVLPHFLKPYLLHVMILIFFYGFLGQSWNILGGFTGQMSFGHAAFFGLGAYTSSLLFFHWGVTPWIGMVAGAFVAMLFGLGVGWICFRYGLRGAFFALVMLAFAEMLRLIFTNVMALGAAQGVLLPLKGSDPLNFQFESKISYYYVVFIMMVLITLFTQRLSQSKMGSYFRAIRENETAAGALGIDVFGYKMRAMAISAFFTGIGGTFFAQYYLHIDPLISYGVGNSVEILLRPIIGGTGTVLGPILGAFVLTPAAELSREFLKGYTGFDLMLYGVILMAVIIYLPYGILGWLERVSKSKPSQVVEIEGKKP